MNVKLFKYLIIEIIMRKEVLIAVTAIFIILAMMVYLYDTEIVKFVSYLRNDVFDYALLSISFMGNNFIIFFFLTSLFLWTEHKRKWILPLWLSSFFTAVVTYLIKILIARPRPFQKGLVSVLQIDFHFIGNNFNTWNFSFPSFQAALVFSALPFLDKEFKKFKYIWIVFACLVAFSRVYFSIHYLSDVIAGAIIGYLIGYVLVLIEEKSKYGRKLVEKLKIKT